MCRLVPVLVCACVVALGTPVSAQLTPITARELLPQVSSRASTDLGSGAYLTNVLFAAIEYQGVSLSMDPASGSATGWVYRAYSPSLDSSLIYVAVRVPFLGDQVLRLPVDTISSLLPVNVGTTALVEPWVDSPAALQGSKSGGAAAFLAAHPEARITLATVVNNPLANPVIPLGEYWMLRYAGSNDTLTCLVWADSGDPLRCTSNNAPRIVSSPVTLARVGELYTYDVDAAGLPEAGYTLETAPAGMSIDAASGLISWTPAPAQVGLHPVTVRAENANGADRQSFAVVVQAAASAPSITSSPPRQTRADEPYVYQLVASGTPPPTFRLTTGPAGMIIDSGRGTIVWTPSRAQAGVHPVSVTARNSAGTDTQNWDLTVVASPRISPISDRTIAPAETLIVRATADGYPAPRFSLLSPPSGMTIDADSGSIRWVPDATQTGAHLVRVEARNTAGAQEQSFTVTVTSTNSVTAPMPGGVEIGVPYPQPLHDGGLMLIPIRAAVPLPLTAAVYDALGRRVRLLPVHTAGPVLRHLAWDGRGDDGRRVPAGRYLLRVVAGGRAAFRPLLVVP